MFIYENQQKMKFFNDIKKTDANPTKVITKYLHNKKINKKTFTDNKFSTYDQALIMLNDPNEINELVSDLSSVGIISVDIVCDISECTRLFNDKRVFEAFKYYLIEYYSDDIDTDLIANDVINKVLTNCDSMSGAITSLGDEIGQDLYIDVYGTYGEWVTDSYQLFYNEIIEANTTLDAIRDWVESKVSGNDVPIYRYMDITSDIDTVGEFSGVGEFWTIDIDQAENYNGTRDNGRKNGVTLYGNVECANIEWYNTILKAFMTTNVEMEIELMCGYSIDIIAADIDNTSDSVNKSKSNDMKYLKKIELSDKNISTYIDDKFNFNVEFDKPITVKI